MGKLTIIFILTLGVFISCKQTAKNDQGGEVVKEQAPETTEATSSKIFGIKTGILVSEMNMMGMGRTTIENNFDNYGQVSLTNANTNITMMNKSMNTMAHTLKKDGWMYIWTEGEKEGKKMKMDKNAFNKDNLDIESLTQEMKDKLKFKEEGSAQVLGKDCKVYSMVVSEKGMTMNGKVYVWEKLPLKSEFSAKGMNFVMEPKSLNENPAFPATMFDVPSDITFTEVSTTAEQVPN